MLKKNELIEIEVIDLGENGEGIGKLEGYTVFIHGGIPGDTVDVQIIKVKKQYAIGRVTNIIKESNLRIESKCKYAKECGGCQMQYIDYEGQLKIKKDIVTSAIERIGGFKDIDVKDVLKMDKPSAYRNKSQYPVRRENHEIQIGFYRQRSHDVVNINECMVQHALVNNVMESLRALITEYQTSIYNEEKHKGYLRHVVVRISHKTNDIMLIFVTNKPNDTYDSQLVKISKLLKDKHPEIKSFIQNINSSKGNRVMGYENKTLLGQDKITDYIKELKFEISPMSFLQVNTIQTEVLYDTALNMLDVSNEDTVLDIYCGIGTISLFLAKHAKKVYGVEVVDVAIKDAKRNAINNNLNNTEFLVGKAEEVIPKLYKEGNKFNKVVLDPPRKGCEEEVLNTLLDMEPEMICYVSCKPSTLARDLKILSAKYELLEVQPVDMFPHTTHVETVVLMSRIDK